MINKHHHYKVSVTWTGNNGLGTENYEVYGREHTIHVAGKPHLECSSDTPFRGDPGKYNPEDFFVSSLSSCHMLWYLHLCAENDVVVQTYTDQAEGVLDISPGQAGHFAQITLYPTVGVADASMIDKAIALHAEAHKKCYIANSCNFPISIQPTCVLASI
jgi:organic hydroperoxide reductase OsmC/OhrA